MLNTKFTPVRNDVLISRNSILSSAFESKVYHKIQWLISLSCGMLIHNVEKSYLEKDVAAFSTIKLQANY